MMTFHRTGSSTNATSKQDAYDDVTCRSTSGAEKSMSVSLMRRPTSVTSFHGDASRPQPEVAATSLERIPSLRERVATLPSQLLEGDTTATKHRMLAGSLVVTDWWS